MKDDEPTEEQKRETMFWDGLAGVIFLVISFIYQYGVEVSWWQPLFR